jgi:hypothetical protein
MARSFVCQHCGQPGEAGATGPIPTYHASCRRLVKRSRRAERAAGPRLSLVPEPLDSPAVPEVVPAAPEVSEQAESLADVVRRELAGVFSAHPAADTLTAAIALLAEVADSPAVRVADPKALPPIVREIRETVRALVEFEAADDDDLFGGMSAPVVVPSAG